jgi:hypothetical protein
MRCILFAAQGGIVMKPGTTGSTLSSGTKDAESRQPRPDHRCCDIDIHIDARGDVNIFNCSTPGGRGQSTECPPFTPSGTCIPVAAGAKHKLSRDQKLARLAQGVPVPSSLAAAAMQIIRRFLLGKSPANPLEVAVFASLAKTSRDLLSCTLSAFDAAPSRQRNQLFTSSLLGDPDQPLDESTFITALRQELIQRISLLAFGNKTALDQEVPGRIRVYEPSGEDFFSQVRICSIDDLRTANFIPALDPGAYLPAEIQHDCAPTIVDGQPQIVCEVKTTNCPGNTISQVCGRVLDIPGGESVVLKGVNYFSVDAKVRFTDVQSGLPVRDVDGFVVGDTVTPVTEVVNGQTQLINDCRVQDQLTFKVPDDLAPKVYQIQVVVPNITGIAILGPELVSNSEFINVVPPATARFEIATDTIICREETSPSWLGSDEVGLHTIAAAFDANFQLVDLPDLSDASKRVTAQDERFKDIQDVDFDTGTNHTITRHVFTHDKQILGVLLVVLGDEIDSQDAYDNQVNSTWDNFVNIVKDELPYIEAAVGGAGGDLLRNFSWTKLIIEGIVLAVVAAIDLLVAWWAPADPLIRDAIALSVNDLATLTSSNEPAPDPSTHTSENGIVVNVNKTIPPVKIPLQYKETREYVGDDSRYEIIYRYNRVA